MLVLFLYKTQAADALQHAELRGLVLDDLCLALRREEGASCSARSLEADSQVKMTWKAKKRGNRER